MADMWRRDLEWPEQRLECSGHIAARTEDKESKVSSSMRKKQSREERCWSFNEGAYVHLNVSDRRKWFAELQQDKNVPNRAQVRVL